MNYKLFSKQQVKGLCLVFGQLKFGFINLIIHEIPIEIDIILNFDGTTENKELL